MVSEKEKADPFRELGRSDIEEWTDSGTISRGEGYKRSGKVEEIKRSPEGGLIAMVQGRKKYFTKVSLKNGELSSVCSCPVGSNCKHGVATVLEYLDLLKRGIEVQPLSEGDPFLIRARSRYEEFEVIERLRTKSSRPPLREWLGKFNQAELIDILVEYSVKSSTLGNYLRDRQDLETENIGGIIESIYSELEGLWEECEEYNPWGHESESPNFSNVQTRMESLLDSGWYEELLELGKEIMNRYDDIVEYDREGEISMEVSGCMGVVFESLSESPRPAHERMFQVFEFELKDEYEITYGHGFWDEKFSREDWKKFAELLKTHLQEIDDGYFPDYSEWKRNHVTDRLVKALNNAGLFEEAISICEHEAEATGSYEQLVEILLGAGRKEKVVEWIHRGVRKTQKENPGIARQLRETLIEIKEKEGDLIFAAALQAEEFFRNPELFPYIKMKEKAEKAGVWQEVREKAHIYLEKGVLPAVQGKNGDETSILPGLLPVTGMLESDSFKDIKAPVLDLLINIAIEEKAPDEVVSWYEKLKKIRETEKRYGYYVNENQIASAICEKYPEIALDIWKKLSEGLISRTKVDAYREAGVYLRKVKETMEAGGQKREWEIYLQGIREGNRRKKRLIEILDTLEKDRIIEG